MGKGKNDCLELPGFSRPIFHEDGILSERRPGINFISATELYNIEMVSVEFCHTVVKLYCYVPPDLNSTNVILGLATYGGVLISNELPADISDVNYP